MTWRVFTCVVWLTIWGAGAALAAEGQADAEEKAAPPSAPSGDLAMCQKVSWVPCTTLAQKSKRTPATKAKHPARSPTKPAGPENHPLVKPAAATPPVLEAALPAEPATGPVPTPAAPPVVSEVVPMEFDTRPDLNFWRLQATVARRVFGVRGTSLFGPEPPPEVHAKDFGLLVERKFGL